jgi:putative ABC transport system substrate-binding protein
MDFIPNMRINPFLRIFPVVLLLMFTACTSSKDSQAPLVGFVDAFEDDTIAQAKAGFLKALSDQGFSEEAGTMRWVYRNAQGDIPTLSQIVNYFISQEVALIASSPTLSTLAAVQRTPDIPVFMMVSPTPALMGLLDASGSAPANLFGVADDVDYIDTSFAMIQSLLPVQDRPLRIGLLYNQSEPQSVSSYERLRQLAEQQGVELVTRAVNTSADVALVTAALLNENIDAFFANPDNTIFSAFETILKACTDARVPVFTSEAGLVKRGAVAAYGADIFEWGYQSGLQAAAFLQKGSTEGLRWELVKVRKYLYNPASADLFEMTLPENFSPVQ